MSLEKVKIYEDEFNIFVLLSARSKIEFLYDATETNAEAAMLKQIAKIETFKNKVYSSNVEDLQIGRYRLCISTFEDIITLNCDSLAVINSFTNKIWQEGHILTRNYDIIKTDVDCYKYFKAFNIIKMKMPISEN